MPDLAGAQIAATQLTLRLTTGAASAQNVRSSLTDFFGNAVAATIFAFNPDVRTSGSSSYFRVKTPADTTLAASTESIGIQIAGSASAATISRQFSTGAITIQREIVCVAPTYAFVGASTITTAATLAVTAAPIAGTNATITAPFAILIQSGSLGLPQGSASNPAIRDATDTGSTTGFYFRSTGGTASIDAVTGSTVRFALNQNGFQIASGGAYGISSGDPAVSAPDVSIVRSAANVMRVTNGSTGAGSLILGTSAGAIGTNGAGVLAFTLSTAPLNFPTDTVQLFSKDAAAADAQLLVANEAGKIARVTGTSFYVTSQFDKTSSTTLSDVPMDGTINVEASTRYSFEAVVYTTSNVAAGVKFAISGTATATTIIYEAIVDNAAAISAQTRATALGTAVGAVTAVTVAYCRITGTILVNAAGTLTLQFAQNVSNAAASSVLIGSNFRIWQS